MKLANQTSVKAKKGFIIFVDVLGTRGIWKRHSPAQIIGWWEFFLSFYTMRFQGLNDYLADKGSLSKNKVRASAFSDTIVITSGSHRPEEMIWELATPLTSLVVDACHKHLFLRGAISYGTFYQGPNMIIGPAVDEAANYHDNLELIGISASPSAKKILEQLERKGQHHGFLKYDIPTKIGVEKNGRTLFWPPFDIITSEGDTSIRDVLKSEMRKQVDPQAMKKLQNTLAFYDYIDTEYMKHAGKVEYAIWDAKKGKHVWM